jgi:RNA polymerase sigma-70 factor (ECF subfamily)
MTDPVFESSGADAPPSAEAGAAATRQPIDIDKLFRDHHQHLQRFIQRYVRNREDAEDVLQNTYMEALRCADRFCGLSKPSTWLFGIGLNLARNHVRRNCAELREELDEALLEQIIDSHADPALIAELREIAGKVEEFLRGLAPEIRATFEAVADGESTYEEAAEQMQVPVGTIRSRVSRVRTAVRAKCG